MEIVNVQITYIVLMIIFYLAMGVCPSIYAFMSGGDGYWYVFLKIAGAIVGLAFLAMGIEFLRSYLCRNQL